jgi:PAS domain S-box-containing protein
MSPTHPAPSDFEAIFQASPGNYLLLSPDLTIVGVNQCYLQATMTKREEIVGRELFEVFPDNPNDPAADGVRNLRSSLQRVLTHKRPDRMPLQHYDIRRPEAEGGGFEERYWSPLNSPVLDQQGNVRYIIHWVEDVTEFVRLKRQMFSQELQTNDARRGGQGMVADGYLKNEAVQAQRRLSEISRHYRFLSDLVPQLIWTADSHGSADYFNQRWVEFTGVDREQLLLNGWARLVHPEDCDDAIALWTETVRTGGDQYQLQHRLRYRDGSYRWVLSTALPYRGYGGRILKWFGSTADVHDKVMTDERLQQAQRLQAAGQLAGGVAHEVNNMMTIVMGCGEFALESLGSDDPARVEVQEMIKAATRAADVTQQLLAYSRQQVFHIQVVDLNEVVRGLTPVLTRLIGSDRQLAIRHAPSPVWVRADRGQLEQVIINLVANARDATGTDGLVRIDTGRVEELRPEQLAERPDDLSSGPFVRLSVRDNGTGMSPEVAARVFEPFFTTKPVGQGTGLGLSMVYGIVKQTGGFPEITTAAGEGTTIAIYLPAVSEEPTVDTVAATKVRARGEQILVVEDDPRVRAVTRRTLQAAGYAVYEAITGLAAVNFMDAHPGEIDLLVSDVVMPGANGRELADLLRATHPDVPIVFMSGYPGTEIERRGLKVPRGAILEKPFTPEALIAMVNETLSRRPSPKVT